MVMMMMMMMIRYKVISLKMPFSYRIVEHFSKIGPDLISSKRKNKNLLKGSLKDYGIDLNFDGTS